jgi:Spy/CpxP family protein refolding chaperone
MGSIAFGGNPAVKQEALARLRSHIVAGTFLYGPAWSEEGVNAIGAIVEADDTHKYSDMLGYPLALATALPSIINAIGPLDNAAQYAEVWLERTPLGADLSKVVSQVLVSVLEEPGVAALTTQHATVEASRSAVVALHRRVIEGNEPDRAEWKSVRMAAVAASDTVTGSPLVRAAGAIVEAAAWPGSMRTVLHDVLGARGGLETKQLLDEIEWSEDKESQVFRIREAAEKTERYAELSGLDRVYALLDADHPELAKGFRQRIQQFEKLGDAIRAIGRQVIELLENAPVAAERGDALPADRA